MGIVALAVDRLRVGYLAIGRDAEVSRGAPGVAVVDPQREAAEVGDDDGDRGDDLVEAVTQMAVAHALSFRWLKTKTRRGKRERPWEMGCVIP